MAQFFPDCFGKFLGKDFLKSGKAGGDFLDFGSSCEKFGWVSVKNIVEKLAGSLPMCLF